MATFGGAFLGQATNSFTTNINWGDGTTSAGTLTLGNNQIYTVTGSHTYATAGEFTITTFMNDNVPDGDVGFATTQADIGFGGQVVLTSASETVSIPSGTQVATFADNSGDPAADYAATIIWGDGNTQVGSVSGSNGSFTVTSTANETYAVEGNYTLTVDITNTADNATIAPAATVAVAGDASLNGSGTTITGSPNVALNNVTLATFSDANTANTAGEFVGIINWGDGTTSTGTISGSNGSFTVTGSHTYTQNAQDAITVGMSEDSDGGLGIAYASVQSTALIGIAPTSASIITATEGTPVPGGTQVATFNDYNLSDTAASFTATIAWGDGGTTSGTVSGSNGSFTVTGGPYTYANYGEDLVTTTLTDTSDGATATAVGIANVADANVLSLTADNISGNAGQLLNNVQLATFSDTYTGTPAGEFEAIVNWGDGTTTLGTVSGAGGSFTVDGSHTYTNGGSDQLTVTVVDDPPGTASATGTATASINFGGQMVLTSATEGTALPGNTSIATFSDSNLSDTASSFTATINWGDGVTTAGTVVGSNGSFTVEGGHTYTNYGTDNVSVTLTQTAEQSSATASGPVTVADGNNLTGQGITFSPTAQTSFSGAVATFTDTYTGSPASEFNATIAWGDGFTTAGTITGSNGSYTVSGSHTYEGGGQYTVTVQGADDPPGTATFSATSTADVSFAGQLVLNSATEGTALPNTTAVATFSDFNPSDTASDFTATINWGDGVTTTGTVVGSPGTFTVEGGHTYANYGNDSASVTITDTADQIQGTFSGTISVADANVLTGHGTSLTAHAGQAFSGTVATFTDTYTPTPASEFIATINWGDGTTSTGTISGANGSFTVTGSHTYVHGGLYTVTVQGEDDPPGTATFSATSSAGVSLPSHYNGQNLSGFIFANQNLAGADFAGSNLSDADFANADLAGADFAGANLQGADLAGANLTGAVVTGANLQTANLTGADLQGANLQGDNLQGADLQNANLQGGNLQGDNLQGDNLTSADLQSADLQGANLQHADLQNANLEDANLQGANLQDANLQGANLQGANLQGANLQGVSYDLAANPTPLVFQNTSGNPDVMIESVIGTAIASSTTLSTPVGWSVVASADFNQDGNTDIVLQNSDGTPEIWVMNGSSVASTVTLPDPGPSWHVIAAADFTGNGNPDLLFQNNDGAAAIWLMNGTTVVGGGVLPVNPGPSWHVIGAGDVNGDGMADILWQNADGTPAIWEMNGTSVIGGGLLPDPGPQWQAIALGDFTGNGLDGILWQANDGEAAIWELNGTSIVGGGLLSPNPGPSWHVIGVDDNADILWQNADGTPAIWQMNGTSIIGGGLLPNPGATWQLKDDGPFSSAQTASSPPTPYLSAPDAALVAPTPSSVPAFTSGYADASGAQSKFVPHS